MERLQGGNGTGSSSQPPNSGPAQAASLPTEIEEEEEAPQRPLLGGLAARGALSSSETLGGPAPSHGDAAKQGLVLGGSGADGGIAVSAATGQMGSFGGVARLEVESGGEGAPLYGSVRRLVVWVLSFAVPGLGMFCEAYFVFSIGNLKGIFEAAYPECFQQHLTCSKDLLHTLTYSQVSGIMLGQLGIGAIADRLGRKLGSVMVAAIMLIFGALIAGSTGSSSGSLFLMFTICQALFGVGVGGEYPVAAASASERAEQTQHLQSRRGETIILTFSMQGVGNLTNTLVIAALMAGFGQTQPPYNQGSLSAVWRLSYGVGLLPVVLMFVWRVWYLKESEVWKRGRQSAAEPSSAGAGRSRKQWLFLRNYWHRIIGPAMCWFVWDWAFYGNKLFQSSFIAIINPGATLLQVLLWTLLNSAVALVGYYFAAFTVDKPWMGRKRMQAMGFALIFLLFLACAVFYHGLIQRHIHLFQALYYLTSFVGQFGPNATTFLLPAELAPTEMRSMCHGFASAVGKAGALLAGLAFNYFSDRTKFYVSSFCGLAGVACTLLFIPDMTGLDLREGDARWQAILEGSPESYRGEAVSPRHLSQLERWLGCGEAYAGVQDAPEGEAAAGRL